MQMLASPPTLPWRPTDVAAGGVTMSQGTRVVPSPGRGDGDGGALNFLHGLQSTGRFIFALACPP